MDTLLFESPHALDKTIEQLLAGIKKKTSAQVLQVLYTEVKGRQDKPLDNALTDNPPQSSLW